MLDNVVGLQNEMHTDTPPNIRDARFITQAEMNEALNVIEPSWNNFGGFASPHKMIDHYGREGWIVIHQPDVVGMFGVVPAPMEYGCGVSFEAVSFVPQTDTNLLSDLYKCASISARHNYIKLVIRVSSKDSLMTECLTHVDAVKMSSDWHDDIQQWMLSDGCTPIPFSYIYSNPMVEIFTAAIKASVHKRISL